MISSADGATAVGGRSGGLSGAGDQDVFTATRAAADVVLVVLTGSGRGGPGTVDLVQAVAELGRRGHDRVLAEGGPSATSEVSTCSWSGLRQATSPAVKDRSSTWTTGCTEPSRTDPRHRAESVAARVAPSRRKRASASVSGSSVRGLAAPNGVFQKEPSRGDHGPT